MADYVEIEDVEYLASTEQAVKIRASTGAGHREVETWVPLSLCDNTRDEIAELEEGDLFTLIAEEWIAIDKDLI